MIPSKTKRERLALLTHELHHERQIKGWNVPVQIGIRSISWYMTKAIFVGQVICPEESGLVGTRVIGSLSSWVEQNRIEIEEALGELSDDEWDYLSQPWDTDNPTTAHELTASLRGG